MKEYPTVPVKVKRGHYYIFDKLDGSNVRGEWNKKNGFWKFGKREGLIDHSNEHLLLAPDLIRNRYEEELSKIFVDNRCTKVTVFFEFHGPQSFAGSHVKGDNFTVTLIDIAVDKKGILEPGTLLKWCRNIEIAKLLHHGNVTDEIEESIQSGEFPEMTFEGVVCKGTYISPGLPDMFKIKNRKWIERLKEKYKDNEKEFNKLL